MGMSKCIKCWDTPCTCGLDYLGWTDEAIDRHIKMLQNVKEVKKEMGVQFTFNETLWANTDKVKRALAKINKKTVS